VAVTEIPTTHFTKLGKDRIAYQVWGEGPRDLLWVPTLGECVDFVWEWPVNASFLRRLGSFSRVITFDRRGMGASDRVSGEALPSWEEWAADALAVLDAVGSERAAVFGSNESGPTAVFFAAAEPERTAALILANTAPRFVTDEDYPWALSESAWDAVVAGVEEVWGTDALGMINSPTSVDPARAQFYARSSRLACSPQTSSTLLRRMKLVDVRRVLPLISVPTLVMQVTGLSMFNPRQAEYLANHIPGAQLVELPGSDLLVFDTPEMLDHIEAFLTGAAPTHQPERALASLLFSDFVGSTELAASLGDRRWRELLSSHDTIVRTLLNQHRGRLIKTTGDGFLALFDGPGRSIRCGLAIRQALRPLGIETRIGIHAGEVELLGDDVGGLAVHIAARVMANAGPGELLVSSSVPSLVVGSGIDFADRGEYELKGVPGTWRLFAVTG
jgi:class 3 adenylate cyclase/pimeloyl-ACP methyl ester carboxylesterase